MLSASVNQDTTGGVRTRGGQELINGTLGREQPVELQRFSQPVLGRQLLRRRWPVSQQLREPVRQRECGQRLFPAVASAPPAVVVVHPGGVTLANQMTDTIGIVEAIGAEGARVTNNVGTTIDRSGYAVLPFLMPYRLNSVNIDPDDAVRRMSSSRARANPSHPG